MNIYLIGALMALIVGIGLFAISSKERGENGEWSDGLQWGYLLTMIGIFGLLAFTMSFTAVLLVFVVIYRRNLAVAQAVFQTRADDHGG